MTAVLVALAAFAAMEPITYAAHRWLMHGVGLRLHRSHHRRWQRAGEGFLEANDAFPAVFAAVTVVALALGFNVDALEVLVPVAIGVTAYGVAYAFVHDVYVHQRIRLARRHLLLDRLAEAHALHHRFGGEPYGMLVPIVPSSVRRRATADAARSR
jgi:beta-carotene 3-hydroxylase